MKWLTTIFIGTGIGLLISPAFVPEMQLYNMTGFIFVAIGWYFMGKMYNQEIDKD